MNIQSRIGRYKVQQGKVRQGRMGTGKIACKIACLFTAVIGLASFSFPAQAHTDLTVVNWGVDAARAQMLALVRPFEQATGKSVNMDHYSGHLVRSIHIGHMLNTDAVSASLKDGVLEVQIPKHTSSERRTITIDSE